MFVHCQLVLIVCVKLIKFQSKSFMFTVQYLIDLYLADEGFFTTEKKHYSIQILEVFAALS